jgi:Ca2+-binding EF-hand superfamily protein
MAHVSYSEFLRRTPAVTTAIALGLVTLLTACDTINSTYDRYLGRSEPKLFRTIYSPNGEVLNGGPLGRPTCEEALTAWFNRIDSNRDGRIGLEEFLADGRKQFAIMDIDHDGLITPSELDRYRAAYKTADDERSTGNTDRRRDPARNSITDSSQPDPVMASDVRLRNQVSLQDYLAHADKVFATMDRKRDGFITRDETLATCKTSTTG